MGGRCGCRTPDLQSIQPGYSCSQAGLLNYGGGACSGRDRGRSEQGDRGAERAGEAEAAEAGAEAGGESGEDWGGGGVKTPGTDDS